MTDLLGKIHCGHVLDVLAEMPEESVQCCVTSPPYWGLRAYAGEQEVVWGGDKECQHEWGEERVLSKINGEDTAGKESGHWSNRKSTSGGGSFCSLCGAWKGGYGLEPSIALYVEHTIEILRAIRRVLRRDGCVFWNLGDSYNGSGGAGGDYNKGGLKEGQPRYPGRNADGLKPKDLCLIPQRVAIACQEDGWWVRSVIIWSKKSPMPESVRDRPTTSHEYILMLTKSANYYYDAEAVREPIASSTLARNLYPHNGSACGEVSVNRKRMAGEQCGDNGRNLRTVWHLSPQPFAAAHFATFVEEIPKRCILAASALQACAKCGKGWEREVEVKGGTIGKGWTSHAADLEEGMSQEGCSGLGGKQDAEGNNYQRQTLGFRPACSCYPEGAEETKPSVILDPFAGSGTTLKVAESLGRSWIGIEIAEDYLPLIEKRLKPVRGQKVLL